MGVQSLYDPGVLPTNVRGTPLHLLFSEWTFYGWEAHADNIYSLGTKMAIPVKILMAYIAISFVIVEIFFYGVWCRPFSNYFAVKVDNDREQWWIPPEQIAC